MPRIKRLIQWEGDPNLLPNREKKQTQCIRISLLLTLHLQRCVRTRIILHFHMYSPIMLFSEFTNSRILWNTDNTKAFISCGGGCFIPILLFRNGKDLKSERFNPESIRKALTSKDEVLLLFASLSYYDKELTKLKDGTTYKLNKTWEDLGLQDLYEEYLKSK